MAGARAGERDCASEQRRREWLARALAETSAPANVLRRLGADPEHDARFAEAEWTLWMRGFELSVLETAPAGFRLLFAERAARIVEALDLTGGGEVLDGCSGRCERCPQRPWCDFGNSPAW